LFLGFLKFGKVFMFFRKVLLICSCLFFASATQNSWGCEVGEAQNEPLQNFAALALGTGCSWGSLPGVGLSSLVLGFGKGYLYSFGNWVSNVKIVRDIVKNNRTYRGIVKNFVVGTSLGTIQSIPGIALNIWKGGWKLGAQKLGIGFLKGCLAGGINSAVPYIMEKTNALSQWFTPDSEPQLRNAVVKQLGQAFPKYVGQIRDILGSDGVNINSEEVLEYGVIVNGQSLNDLKYDLENILRRQGVQGEMIQSILDSIVEAQ
jgi:hypothetical protein